MRLSALIILLAVFGTGAFGQLHLMTGTPWDQGTISYPSLLLRVENNGKLTEVELIVTAQEGSTWIGASYDWRKALILSSDVIVVDFDTAKVVKRCGFKELPGNAWMYFWLADPPAPGPSFEWLESGPDVARDQVVRGMVLDPSVPCEKSFATLEPEAVRYALAHGHPGIADIVNSDGVRTITADDGNVTVSIAGKNVPLGYSVPSSFRNGFQKTAEGVAINNSHALVLSMGDGIGDYRDFVFRKSDKSWRSLPALIGKLADLRGFGRYIAATETRPKNAQNPRSAGMDKWKPKYGPDIREALKNMEPHLSIVYPGRLHLYDIETERVYTITTNQGDSEVLLVENGTVYYRAADELYSAPITSEGIGPGKLLATDDLIRDAHWAFIKR